ncbi:MAG: NAD(P)/FAD-dependent oxidoreductase [Bacteroidota bacterium]
MNIPETNHPRVVIIGGGFGGLMLAKSLRGKNFQVVLIDRHNYHTFQPLLYQVATSGLEPDSIAYPIRKIFEGYPEFYFRMASAERIDAAAQTLHTNIGPVRYDHLVVATGSDTNFFGLEGLQTRSMAMKSVPDALDLRSLILQNFEKALLTKDLEERESLMNFVIVGGGPTGTELAGALGELKRHVLPKDYPDLDIRRMNIHLIEAAPRVLAAMSEVASEKAARFLEKLGVQVWTDLRVTTYDGRLVNTSGGQEFRSHTVIWAAGVMGAPVEGLPAEALQRNFRVAVDAFSRVEGQENIYAIGDVAHMPTEAYPKGHPMMAQPAMQQGQHLARNLKRSLQGKPMVPFRFKDLGSMATVGRNLAVVDLPRFRFQGFFAWFVWMFIHLIQLVGFRNKLVVLLNWMWSYYKFDRGTRLIIRPFRRK